MPDRDAPNQTLWRLRLLWAASLVFQAVLAAVVLWMVGEASGPPPSWAPTLVYVAAAALLVLTPVGYFMRNEVYKANWRGDAISPRGYFTGNLALFAMTETVSLGSIIIGWAGGRALPALYVAGAAMLVQLINFPTGRPMQPTPPVFGRRDAS